MKKEEKRAFPRGCTEFSVRIDSDFLGRGVDLSETGMSFVFNRSLLVSRVQVRIELSQSQLIDSNIRVVWKRYLFGEGKFQYGASFVDLEDENIRLLRNIVCSSIGIDQDFIEIAESFEGFLKSVKNKFDEFDKNNKFKNQRIQFLELRKNEMARKIDDYLRKLWSIMKQLDKSHWDSHTYYLRAIVNYLFIYACEINNHIFKKPLGYSGDFITANYIFDYYRNNYLGESSYEMFINHFTCNIPIARSNIKRKDFLKSKILETVERVKNAKILNIGSGSARELLELLSEGKLKKNLIFHCLDFEMKAINYLKREIRKINPKKRLYCNIKCINKNFIELTKNRNLGGLSRGYDFIYCSGIFGYLKDRIASRLVNVLFSLLNKNGILILCSANNKNSFYRVAYEVMGNWVFYHREKEKLIQWLRNVKNVKEIKFERLSDISNYHFLSVKANP